MSSLPTNLIKEFVKMTDDSKTEKIQTQLRGTASVEADGIYVILDGSDVRTPVSMATDAQTGDRVLVEIVDHSARIIQTIDKSGSDNVAVRIQNDGTGVFKNLRVATEYVDTLVAGDITADSIIADRAEIADLKTKKLDAEQADIKYATIDNLNAANAIIEDLKTKKIDAETADIKYATIDSLDATNATIKDLNADVAKIDTLMFGSASGDTIQTNFANSVIAQLGDAQIKSAMIDSVSASKITSGEIITNNVRVLSEDGSLVISDETIQISDESRVRVQIGKDAANDYSINIWDASGKLMFSEGGITDNAIKEAIIRNDMVSETANISASKLDIDSLFEEINGSTKTINSTKIYLDDKKQTLDVTFKSLTTDINNLSNTVSSQGMSISAIQGQIENKVWQQDIDDATGELSTQYTSLKTDLEGLSSTVSKEYLKSSDASNIYSTKTDLTQTAASISASIKSDISGLYQSKEIPDTRNDNQNPIWYISNYPRQQVTEFKYCNVIGLSGKGETYCSLTTTIPWKDSTGGYPKQVAKIAGKEYWRIGISDTTWGSWNDASTTATNYLNFSNAGLVVGDMTASTLGSHVLIDTDSVDIRNGSTTLATFGATTTIGQSTARNVYINSESVDVRMGETVLSTFTDNSIWLAKDNASATIYMCGRAGSISVDRKGDNDFFTVYGDNIRVFGRGAVHIESEADYSGNEFATFIAESYNTLSGRGASVNIVAETPIINDTTDTDLGHASIKFASYSTSNPYMTLCVIDTSRSSKDEISIVPNSITLTSESTKVNGKFTSTDVIIAESNIKVNGKTINDLKEGIFISKEGYMQIQRLSGSPYIDFIYSDQAASCGRVGINTSTKHMEFTKSSRYMYDATVEITSGSIASYNSVYAGYGAAYTAARGLYFPYADDANHAAVYRNTDGLTTYFGWAGSASYSTVSILRGRTVKYSNATATTTLSDERLKKDFTTLEQWDTFYDSLEPCAFRMKNGSSGRYHIGFKAQQVEEALLNAGLSTNDFAGFIRMPYLPDDEDPEGCKVYEEAGINAGDNELGLIYSEFTALNTYKIQKMQKRIDELEKLVEQLLSS